LLEMQTRTQDEGDQGRDRPKMCMSPHYQINHLHFLGWKGFDFRGLETETTEGRIQFVNEKIV